MPPLKWDTQKDAMHSVRVLCDEYKLNWEQKATICSCIWQESNFMSYYLSGAKKGQPVKYENKNDFGRVTSTDWGLVQINDTPKFGHIGPKGEFKSVQDVLDNPEKCARYMIRMFKAGKISLWSSYKFGHYKKWMPYFMTRDKWLELLKK